LFKIITLSLMSRLLKGVEYFGCGMNQAELYLNLGFSSFRLLDQTE
jgi:hypothetical protein